MYSRVRGQVADATVSTRASVAVLFSSGTSILRDRCYTSKWITSEWLVIQGRSREAPTNGPQTPRTNIRGSRRQPAIFEVTPVTGGHWLVEGRATLLTISSIKLVSPIPLTALG